MEGALGALDYTAKPSNSYSQSAQPVSHRGSRGSTAAFIGFPALDRPSAFLEDIIARVIHAILTRPCHISQTADRLTDNVSIVENTYEVMPTEHDLPMLLYMAEPAKFATLPSLDDLQYLVHC